MKAYSFIFAGSSPISLNCLKLLLKQTELQIKGIVCQPDRLKGRGLKQQVSVVKRFALSQNISVWTPDSCKEATFLDEIEKQSADFCFVCAYGQILPVTYLKLFPKKALNLHFSLLPKWRGAAPIQRALMAGDKKTGVCLQVMTQKLDAGDLIASCEFGITETDNAETLFEHSLKHTKELIKSSLISYLKDPDFELNTQDNSKATYASKIDKQRACIDWKQPAVNIHNNIRALYLGPQAFFFFNKKRIKIFRSHMIKKSTVGFAYGKVCHLSSHELYVTCGTHILSVLEVQKEGKKRQSIEEFLKGNSFSLGDSFISL